MTMSFVVSAGSDTSKIESVKAFSVLPKRREEWDIVVGI
jgi:hypothetical protein